MTTVNSYNDPPVVERTFADFNEYYAAKNAFWAEVDALCLRRRWGVVVTWESPVFNSSGDFHGAVSGHADFMRAVRDASILMGSDTLHQYFSGNMAGSDVTFRVYEGTNQMHLVTRNEDVRYR